MVVQGLLVSQGNQMVQVGRVVLVVWEALGFLVGRVVQGEPGGRGRIGGLGGPGGLGGLGEAGAIGGIGGPGGPGGRGQLDKLSANGTRRLVQLAIVLILAVFLATMTVAVVNIMQVDQPPVEFTKAVIEPSMVCGTTIHYTISIRYRETPAVMMSTRSVFDMDKGKTALWDYNPRYTVITEKQVTNASQIYEMASPLPPGSYELRIGSQTSTSKPAIAVMSFTVPESCP